MLVDLTNVAESGSEFECLPPGEYPFVIEDAEVKETRAGNGEYIKTKMKVAHGPYRGRVVFDMFNIKNPNSQAVNIGLGQLKTMLRLAGLDATKLGSVTELLGAKINAVVKIRKSDQYDDQNTVSFYKPFVAETPSLNKDEEIPF